MHSPSSSGNSKSCPEGRPATRISLCHRNIYFSGMYISIYNRNTLYIYIYIPDTGIEPRSAALQADSLLDELPGKPHTHTHTHTHTHHTHTHHTHHTHTHTHTTHTHHTHTHTHTDTHTHTPLPANRSVFLCLRQKEAPLLGPHVWTWNRLESKAPRSVVGTIQNVPRYSGLE